jgi:hypothetical protein
MKLLTAKHAKKKTAKSAKGINTELKETARNLKK